MSKSLASMNGEVTRATSEDDVVSSQSTSKLNRVEVFERTSTLIALAGIAEARTMAAVSATIQFLLEERTFVGVARGVLGAGWRFIVGVSSDVL
jgi:hypothetical protein